LGLEVGPLSLSQRVDGEGHQDVVDAAREFPRQLDVAAALDASRDDRLGVLAGLYCPGTPLLTPLRQGQHLLVLRLPRRPPRLFVDLGQLPPSGLPAIALLDPLPSPRSLTPDRCVPRAELRADGRRHTYAVRHGGAGGAPLAL